MACKGCASSGDCGCVIVGDSGVVVTGAGSIGSPYVISFDAEAWFASLPEESADLCDPDALVLAKLADDSIALIPAPGRCAVIL